MKKLSFSTLYLFWAVLLNAQSTPTLEAVRLSCSPSIDGQLTDSCWQGLQPLEAFTTAAPVFDKAPLCRTEVHLFYTETALYVAARCFNSNASRVRDDGGIRDGELTGDWFQLSLDTWNDDRMAFDFTVSAAGVPYDTRNNSGWNAGWQSAVSLQADGWTLEMHIPFTALRFPRKAEQNWGLQFTRYDRGTGETSTWSPQDPLVGDRVLQFGTLSGLHYLHQRRRLGLSAYSNTVLETRSNPFEATRLSQTLGLDGRIGLNESATLDFTLLPSTRGRVDLNNLFVPLKVELQHNADVEQPRQMFQEERDLFDKNTRLNYNPVVYWSPFLNDHPLEPGERYTDLSESKLLHAAKLTARTKGNWRFGVYNAFLGPVKATISQDSTGEIYDRTLRAFSNYNYTSAEYVLPNNGFIQLSNAGLLAGPNLTTAAPKLDFQLRDPGNTIELGGTAQMSYTQSDTIREKYYTYGLRLARVNRRWGWSLSLSENYVPANDRTLSILSGAATAGINYRDYRPHGPFLNVEGALIFYLNYFNKISLPDDVFNVFGHIAAKDRHFRRFALRLSARPYSARQRYNNGNAYLYRKIAPTVFPGFSFTTDQRKRFIGTVDLAATVNTAGEVSYMGLTLQPSWVISRRFRLLADVAMRGWFGSLSAISIPGRWIFEQRDAWELNSNLNLHWYPMERLLIFGAISANCQKFAKRKTVEMQSIGEIIPVDWPLPPDYSPVYGEAALGFQYFFTPLSQIRFQHSFGENESLYFPQPGAYRTRGTTDLTVIYFLDGTAKR